MFTITEIKEIIKMVTESPVQHFALEQGNTKIVIDRVSANQSSPIAVPAAAEQITLKPNQEQKAEHPAEFQPILSTSVGTFYAASEPGADPFVKPGQKVMANTVVCVLEAMKLFNEIEAGITGEIVEVLCKDGEFVEYGQPLFLVKPE
ncbi:acetyl-CoA carboxylase biotin carboxyl carrier protein [Anaerospora sp.]|jgi:acetyl-CoA carboxylase biotin carboxyl carrier protein|uniref:acetyl-CoA carboxylase biotin carboxyl carrier protein n=1 Tax=Anaerospora sp. TaxID=1960278 RepID=UPI002897505B|nr:acetyl-CoA carboxylase biotin carboxyl carrier protein [Anaerospora sp.]MDF2928856.1 acetyl-CoA carboxylase, biotin carboxyl carrier protein [Anaerospora sp.]